MSMRSSSVSRSARDAAAANRPARRRRLEGPAKCGLAAAAVGRRDARRGASVAVARPADDPCAARETVAVVQDARAVVVALIVPLHSLGVLPRVGDGGANPFGHVKWIKSESGWGPRLGTSGKAEPGPGLGV
mmetsp:Transcript_1243/g.5380  ORF Transcript_1243/g.5380 Transcript_1243/m.5380 type:complete len:132 (+) Transcript_1243:2434-2829(+)